MDNTSKGRKRREPVGSVRKSFPFTEAMKLATKILVVDAGRVQQFASPDELAARPATPFVRELLATQGFLAPAGRDAAPKASSEGR